MGDKCKLIQPKAPRVGDKCERQRRETSENSCGPRHPEWETSVRIKWEASGGNRSETIWPKVPEWKTSVGDKCARQVWEPSVGDKCGRQVWETSVNSCGPRHPE